MYAYVVIFTGVTRDAFVAYLRENDIDGVANWSAYLPQTVFIQSDLTAQELSRRLLVEIPGIARILVLDAKTDRSGRMPMTAWTFLSPEE
jgi:hypothetical protein